MLTLCLLRHAKSSWADSSVDDHDRPLSDRGRRDTPIVGEALVSAGLAPDLIVCSTARRTRETLDLLAPVLGDRAIETTYDEAIYEVPTSSLIAQIRQLPDVRRTVLIIGHNPGMQGAALDLTGTGETKEVRRLATKFPTAALAVIDFEHDRWASVRPASGCLRLFVRPKDLRAAGC